MEITSAPSTPRPTKVRAAKSTVPKSSAAKPLAATAANKPKATVENPAAKSKAAPRKRKATVVAEAWPAADLTPMIATAAYYLAEKRQFAPGYEMQDWLAAEHFIRSSMTGRRGR